MNQSQYAMGSMKRQQGMALFVVLILLLILSLAVAALLHNQRLAVQQLADRLAVLDANSASTVTHDACVNALRGSLTQSDTVTLGYAGEMAVAAVDDARWESLPQKCLYEWYQLPADDVNFWTPHVRVTSLSQTGGRYLREVSEWRYPLCVQGVLCAQAGHVQVVYPAGDTRLLSVRYRANGLVQTARQQLP